MNDRVADDAEIHVMAGVIRDGFGRILLAQRPPGGHLAGLWEFPGGKREPGESRFDALVRELNEELGIRVHSAQPLIGVPFSYPGKRIHLDVWRIDGYDGEPWSREGQAIQWVDESALRDYPMPAADHPVVVALRLPTQYAITPDWGPDRRQELERAVDRALVHGIRLIRLRLPQWSPSATRELTTVLLPRVHASGAHLLASDVETAMACGLDGVHLSVAAATRLDQRPLGRDQWFAMSCHDADELRHAVRIGADFATLSPIQATTSHPNASSLGWDAFERLVRDSAVPVYALGGVGPGILATAQSHGAQGVAGIGQFWSD